MNRRNYTTALTLGISLISLGCCIDGSGDIEKDDRSIRRFSNLSLDIPGTVYISNGETDGVTIRTDDNLLSHISAKVSGDTLVIETDPHNTCIDPTKLEVYVSTTDLERIDIDGSADVVIEDPFETEDFTLSIDGSGDIVSEPVITADRMTFDIDGSGDLKLNLDVGDLSTTISGAGNVKLSGEADTHHIGISGSGDVKAYHLQTESTVIKITGSGSCRVAASETLKVTIDGSGSVYYRGDPSTTQKISGSGTVKQTD